MTEQPHQPHDKFAKEFLEELLAPLGEVKINREVKTIRNSQFAIRN